MTIVVNLIAGPGTGKSTTAAGLFAELKLGGVNAELVQEYAKDLVWGRTTATLDNQLYVFAKQHHRLFRLQGQVDVIVTDSPIFLMLYYGRKQSAAFEKLVLEEFEKLDNHNVFLQRSKRFNPAGRLQTEDEAKDIDAELLRLLDHYGIEYSTELADSHAATRIATDVFRKLGM